MAVEWSAAEVDPDRDATTPPSPETWTRVTVPGRPTTFAGSDAVAYRTTFSDPRSSRDQRAILSLEGVYARTRIWVDGQRVASGDVYFDPVRVEVDPSGETELIVECLAPDDRFGGVYATDVVPEEWAVPGIWWDATMLLRPPTYLADLSVTPRLDDPDGDATIDVTVSVDSAEGVSDTVTLSLRPEGHRGRGSMARVRVEAAPGKRTTVSESLELRDPDLWWPRGYGDQARYRVRASLGENEVSRVTGLRTIEYDGEDLLVNGDPVSARGVNLLPSEAYGEDLNRAATANATVVRPHGHVPPPGVHEACDRLGLLVWQDLPLVGPGSFDTERATTIAETLVDERGRYPSVALYSVHTGPTAPFGSPLGSGALDRLRLRWRAWRSSCDHDAPERVAGAFPGDAVVFPVVGGLGCDPDAADVFPGWDYGDPEDVEWLLDRYPDLGTAVGAFGAGSLAEGATEGTFDRTTHDAKVGSDDPEDSQAYQSRTLKTVAESLRRRDCPIMASFALRDVYHGGGMGVLAVDGTEKRGYRSLAASFEPVQAVLNAPLESADGVLVLNDGPEGVDCTLHWQVGDREGDADVVVPPHGRTAVDTLNLTDDTERVLLELELPDRTVVNEYDR